MKYTLKVSDSEKGTDLGRLTLDATDNSEARKLADGILRLMSKGEEGRGITGILYSVASYSLIGHLSVKNGILHVL